MLRLVIAALVAVGTQTTSSSAAAAATTNGAAAATNGGAAYLEAAMSVYESGLLSRGHYLPPPDTWSLAAALIAKHTKNATWVARAAAQLESFTDVWVNATNNGSTTYPNGTAKPFGYGRSGFVGWSIPLAYKVLRDNGQAPAWDAPRLDTFKRALDSWLSPSNEAVMSGGLLELGNWNKGFQHLADAAAVLAVFPEVDRWENNRGLYAAFVNRTWRSWQEQHCYPENSVNYNAISVQIIVNVLPMALPEAAADLRQSNLTYFLLKTFSSYFDPGGCMPAFGASNGICESTSLFLSAFEAMASISRDPELRYAARLCADHLGLEDPIATMLAYDQGDHTLSNAVPTDGAGGEVSLRVEARNRQAQGALLPDKMTLTVPRIATNGSAAPWVMLELWAALSLYHEATPQIVGDLIEVSHNRTVFTIPTGRKHSPDIAQGNSLLLLPSSPSAKAQFPWFGSAQMVPEPSAWQELTTSTRFLQVESNVMDQYTTRWIHGLNISCDAALNADQTKAFDLLIYKIELIRPNGSSFILEDFSRSGASAWPGATLSEDVPAGGGGGGGGGGGKSMLIHCAANTTTTVSRPSPSFDLVFDVVEDYTHLRYHWKTSRAFSFANTSGYSVPLSMDWRYAVPAQVRNASLLRCHFILNMIILPRQARDKHRENSKKRWVFLQDALSSQEGDVTAGDFGRDIGGFRDSWYYPTVSANRSETMASADTHGNSGGLATIRHMWGYGSVWRRGLVLLRNGVLAVIDDVALGPAQQSSGVEYIAGPVFALNTGASEGPRAAAGGLSYWHARQFGGSNSSAPLLVAMAGAEHANMTVCNTMAGAASCRPDLPPCDPTAMCGRRRCTCPHTSVFGYSSLSASSRSTIVTLLVPLPHDAGLQPPSAARVGQIKVAAAAAGGGQVSVELGGSWGSPGSQRIAFDLSTGDWSVQ
jgi:hypothetical protein